MANYIVRVLPSVFLLVGVTVDSHAQDIGNGRTSGVQCGPSTFRAAVYQHAVHNWFLPNITRQEALALMNKNVDVYEAQIEIASSKGVSLIVFPEYGITGFQLSLQTILPFLEFVPNPYQHQVIPCIQTELSSSPILQRLSCLARKHSTIIVANFATTMPCEKSPIDPNCPPDDMYRYNTDIALGANGKLLAKYNKENLYGEELLMFQPGKGLDNLSVFKTEFGVFGMFTCFDMLFREPAETLMNTLGVTNMVFPTAWINELPLLSAVEYQEAWAIRYDVNLLAANIQFPLLLMTGGGLFAGTQGAVMYHHDMTDFKGTLLIGELPVRSQRPPKLNTRAFKNLSSHIKKLTPEELKMVSPVVRTILEDAARSWKTQNNVYESARQPHLLPSIISPSPTSEKSFSSMMNHDPYTFVLLTQNVGRVSVCSGTLCCHLNYTFGTSSQKRGMFALGVFNGLHKHNGQYYVQTCALVKCKFDTQSSCGAQAVQSHTRIESFSLAVEGFDQSTRLFPSVLTSDVRLAVIGKDWETQLPFDRIWSNSGTTGSLLVASIFGRLYIKD